MAARYSVVEVHDLHIWEITSGSPALSARVLVEATRDCHAARVDLARMLADDHHIDHTTLQVDHVRPGATAASEVGSCAHCEDPHGAPPIALTKPPERQGDSQQWQSPRSWFISSSACSPSGGAVGCSTAAPAPLGSAAYSGRPGSLEWLAGAGFVVAIVVGVAAPVLQLLGVVAPVEILAQPMGPGCRNGAGGHWHRCHSVRPTRDGRVLANRR